MASSHILVDDFADSVISTRGPRWSKVTRYWPTLLWNQGAETVSGFAMEPTEAELHDKYLASDHCAAARVYPDAGVDRKLAAFTHRLDQSEDQVVRATYKMVDVAGGQQDFHKFKVWAGVGARITGETGTEFDTGSGYPEMLIAPTGYYFWLLSRFAGGHGVLKFALHKVTGPATAGADSTIEELESVVWTGGPYTEDELQAGLTFGLRLSCVTTLGVVELRGYYTDSSGEETEIVSHDEGTGGLTESGHALFATTTEIVDPSQVSDHGFVMGVVNFEVQDTDGAIVMRDQFDRVNLSSAVEAGQDAFWVTGEDNGHVLTGMYTGDQAGEDVTGELPQFADRLERHPSIAKLEVDSDPQGGHHLFFQPPSNIYAQAVSVTVEFAVGGAGVNRIAGVSVRRALGENNNHAALTSATESAGYTVAMHYDGVSSAWALRVHRYSNDAWSVIAYRVMNASGDPVTFVLGTAWTLRVDVENRDGANAATGNVHLEIEVDDNLFTDWTILEPGVIEESDGSLTDTSSSRVLSGGATGFFASNLEGGTGGGEVFIEEARQIDVALDVTETEQKSTFVPGEIDDISGTLTVPHEWPVETIYEDYSVAHPLDSAHVHRHGIGSRQRRRWRIASKAAKKTEVDDLRDFFLSHGATVPFNWTTPDGEAVFAALEKTSLKSRKVDYKTYDFEVTVVELIGLDQECGFAMWLNSNIPFSGGGVEIVDDPVGTIGPFYAVFHVADGYGTLTMTVNLANTSVGGEIVVVELGGDAVEGLNYTNDSDPGSNLVTLVAGEGDDELTFTITTLATGKWHPERRLEMVLNQDLTNVNVVDLDDRLHLYIHSTTAPPHVEFALSGQTADRGSTATFDVQKPTGSPEHEENLSIFMEVDAASTGVEGDDYEWLVGTGDPYGLYTIAPEGTSRTVYMKILPSAISGRTVIVNLRHEESDRSEKNLWTRTDSMELEQNENTEKIYPGEPSDNVTGPGGILPPNPLDVWVSDDQTDPWRRYTVSILKLRDVARGSGYHRKGQGGQAQCGAPHDEEGGAQISMPLWVRYSMYVMIARPGGVPLPFPRFFRLGVRDRGFSLDPPQKPNQTGLGEQNYGVFFDSQYPGSGGVVDDDGLTWGVHGVTSNWPVTSGDYGIEIDTLRYHNGLTFDRARLWLLYHEDNPLRLGHAMTRIFYPVYFGQGVTGTGENLANNKGKAVAMFWPYLETSDTGLSGPPPLYHPRDGFFDAPLGQCLKLTGGQQSHTITVS